MDNKQNPEIKSWFAGTSNAKIQEEILARRDPSVRMDRSLSSITPPSRSFSTRR